MNIHLQKNQGEMPAHVAYWENVTPDPEDFKEAGVISIFVEGLLIYRAFHEYRFQMGGGISQMLAAVGVSTEDYGETWRVTIASDSAAARFFSELSIN